MRLHLDVEWRQHEIQKNPLVRLIELLLKDLEQDALRLAPEPVQQMGEIFLHEAKQTVGEFVLLEEVLLVVAEHLEEDLQKVLEEGTLDSLVSRYQKREQSLEFPGEISLLVLGLVDAGDE